MSCNLLLYIGYNQQKKAVIAKGRGKIMVNEVMDFITGYDKEVGEAIQAECARQRRNLELIASENIVSGACHDGYGDSSHQ